MKSEYPSSNSKIHIEVLPRIDTNSPPQAILNMLDEFKDEYLLQEGDELWMVIDRDKQSWTEATISGIASLCNQKGYLLALSNPAFEIWLLLHVKNLSEYSDTDKTRLLENRKVNRSRTYLEQELFNICGSYNKKNPNLNDFLPNIAIAISRAEALIENENERWPNYLGTHVYRLVKRIISFQ